MSGTLVLGHTLDIHSLGQFGAVLLGKFVSSLKDTIRLVLLLLTLLEPVVRQDILIVFHHHITKRSSGDNSTDATLNKASSSIATFDHDSSNAFHNAAKETCAVLILPSSHRQESIPAGLTSLAEQELLRIIKDSLTPAGLHIHAIQHRLEVAHRIGLAGLARVNLTFLGH